jgi:hypothetical protein
MPKAIRSLKDDIPPPEELRRAKAEILNAWKLFDARKTKLRMGNSDDRQRVEEIFERITKLLWERKRVGIFRVLIYNNVLGNCPRPRASKPAAIEDSVKECVKAANKLHRLLGRRDFPANYQFQISEGRADKWNLFIGCLERAMQLKYTKPPKQSDNKKIDCALSAYILIKRYTTARPTKSRDGLFYTVTDLLYQVGNPAADDGNANKLKYICDKVLDRVGEGFDPERDRWR